MFRQQRASYFRPEMSTVSTRNTGRAIALLILIALRSLAVGCSSAPTPTPTHVPPTATSAPTVTSTPTATPTATLVPPTPTPELPRVALVEPELRTIDYEEFEWRNCDSTEELVRLVASVAPVRGEASIAEYATPVSGGDRLPVADDLRKALETLVYDAYEETFSRAQAEGASDEFVVPPDRVIAFRLLWEKQKYVGTVYFPIDGVTHAAEYTYTMVVPKRVGHRMISCTA